MASLSAARRTRKSPLRWSEQLLSVDADDELNRVLLHQSQTAGFNCILSAPADGWVAVIDTPVAAKAIPNVVPIVGPCPLGTVQFFQNSTLIGIADHDPYEIPFTPTVPGMYSITAVNVLSSGESQTSDPATLRVTDGEPDPDSH